MKKSLLQKQIKNFLLEHGFEQFKNENYAILAGDCKTKLILKIPNGKNGSGFVLGAQFEDFGTFDGILTNAVMRQFDFAYELAFPQTYEYTDEQIADVLQRLWTAYLPYINEGAEAIKARIDQWTFGDNSEKERGLVLRYFGFPGIDPYSKEYQEEKADFMNDHGGMIVIPLQEYLEHREFYDNYQNYHAKISMDKKYNEVQIHFFSQPKWYQQ